MLAGLALCVPWRAAGAQIDAPRRLDAGRFTVVFYPADERLASSLLDRAVHADSFPGLPRPMQRVLLAIAPDKTTFREWTGPDAPEWGGAITFPDQRRVVMQGHRASSDAGDPVEVLRHELAHLALHEYLGDLPPRWFDEGYASYAAHEWTRDDALTTNVGLLLHGMPTFEQLDTWFSEGSSTAQTAYALAYRAVVELASLDANAGLSKFFSNWKARGTLDGAVRATYGITLDGFEKLWQQQTRRRYGALALVGDVAVGGFLLLVVILPLYVVKRQRDRRRMAALVAADEAAERAARLGALEELMRFDRGDEPADPESPPRPGPGAAGPP